VNDLASTHVKCNLIAYLIFYGVSNASLGKFLCQENSRGQELLVNSLVYL
jgi:hypothetical protein